MKGKTLATITLSLIVGCAGGYVASVTTPTADAQGTASVEYLYDCTGGSLARTTEWINEYAADGWRVITLHGETGTCVLLERDI